MNLRKKRFYLHARERERGGFGLVWFEIVVFNFKKLHCIVVGKRDSGKFAHAMVYHWKGFLPLNWIYFMSFSCPV